MSIAAAERQLDPARASARDSRAARGWPWLVLVLVVSWLARGGYLWIKPPQAVAMDSLYWARATQLLLDGHNPYAETTFLNYPPLWLQCLYLLGRAARATGVDFFTLLRLLLIVVESLLIVATWRLVRQLVPHASPRLLAAALLAAIGINPAAIVQVCQHGNFDVLMMLWVVLSLTSLIRHARRNDAIDWLIACAWLGLAMLTKTVPVVLAPLLAIGARALPAKVRALGAALVFGPVALGVSIIYVLAPAGVWRNVIRYRSLPGWYGITGFLLITGADRAVDVYGAIFTLVTLLAIVVAMIVLWRRPALDARRIVLLAALALLAIPNLGPGYAPQYVYWFLPLFAACFVAFPVRWWRRLLVCTLLVVAATYVFEYGLFPTHGALFLNLWPHDESVARLSRLWSDWTGQTLMRLPIFVMYLAVLTGGVVLLCRRRRAENLSDASAVEAVG